MISAHFSPKSVTLCALRPVLGDSHPSSNDTLSLTTQHSKPPLLYSHDQKRESYMLFHRSLSTKLSPIVAFITYLKRKIQVVAFMIKP